MTLGNSFTPSPGDKDNKQQSQPPSPQPKPCSLTSMLIACKGPIEELDGNSDIQLLLQEQWEGTVEAPLRAALEVRDNGEYEALEPDTRQWPGTDSAYRNDGGLVSLHAFRDPTSEEFLIPDLSALLSHGNPRAAITEFVAPERFDSADGIPSAFIRREISKDDFGVFQVHAEVCFSADGLKQAMVHLADLNHFGSSYLKHLIEDRMVGLLESVARMHLAKRTAPPEDAEDKLRSQYKSQGLSSEEIELRIRQQSEVNGLKLRKSWNGGSNENAERMYRRQLNEHTASLTAELIHDGYHQVRSVEVLGIGNKGEYTVCIGLRDLPRDLINRRDSHDGGYHTAYELRQREFTIHLNELGQVILTGPR